MRNPTGFINHLTNTLLGKNIINPLQSLEGNILVHVRDNDSGDLGKYEL